MSRLRRHETIRQILGSETCPSQEALQHALAEQGIEVAQATLSRDLREMGVAKGPRGYQLLDSDSAAGRPSAGGSGAVILGQYTIGVAPAHGVVVVRTSPGSAGVVALELDRHPPAGVAGTIAGDDTIFVAVTTGTKPAQVAAELAELAGLPGVMP